MVRPTHVHTIGYVAMLIGENLELIQEIASNSDNIDYGEMIIGNVRGGETFAILASLINSAKLNGLDPQRWLADVLERVVSGQTTIKQLDTLLPWNWSDEKVRQAA